MTSSSLLRALRHAPPAISGTERPVPRWVLRLAYALPLLLLPSCLWRLPFAFHFKMGQGEQSGEMWPIWASIPYVFGLSILTELIAILCLGLVRGWGEVAPRWIPFIGGKPVPRLAAVIPAVIGGLALTVLFTSVPLGADQELTFFGVADTVPYDNGWWNLLATVCTGPLRIWGPIVLVLAVAYYVRRRPGTVDRAPTAVHEPATT